jgi:hypothetical protein
VLVQIRGLPAMETLTFEAVMKDKSLDGQPQLFKEEVKVWMDVMTMRRY